MSANKLIPIIRAETEQLKNIKRWRAERLIGTYPSMLYALELAERGEIEAKGIYYEIQDIIDHIEAEMLRRMKRKK